MNNKKYKRIKLQQLHRKMLKKISQFIIEQN